MNAKSYMLLAAALVALAAPGPIARAGSIWARAQQNRVAPRGYTDDTARQVGDVLTIVINEKSAVDNQTKRDNDKKNDRTANASASLTSNSMAKWFGKDTKSTFVAPTGTVASSAETKFQGQADYTATRSVTDSITVTVYDVLPNGNLVVMGCRERRIDGETQVMNLSGIVRPSDVTFANTIPSEQVAEFQMVTAVKGPDASFAKPGWLSSFFNFFSPW